MRLRASEQSHTRVSNSIMGLTFTYNLFLATMQPHVHVMRFQRPLWGDSIGHVRQHVDLPSPVLLICRAAVSSVAQKSSRQLQTVNVCMACNERSLMRLPHCRFSVKRSSRSSRRGSRRRPGSREDIDLAEASVPSAVYRSSSLADGPGDGAHQSAAGAGNPFDAAATAGGPGGAR